MRVVGGFLAFATLLALVHCSGSPGSAPVAPQAEGPDTSGQQRLDMVRDQIEARGVRDAEVLAAMRQVPRHRFVPAEAREMAYTDSPLPIGEGQTISQPYIVALMTELLQLEKTHKVLEIGTGSGYQAAVLALLAGEVHSVEIVESLADRSQKLLHELGYKVQVYHGDGYQGLPEQAPFDRIILTAAPPEMPAVLVDQLAAGGRLVAPVGPVGGVQELVLLEKDADGEVRSMNVIGVRFVPMVPGKSERQ